MLREIAKAQPIQGPAPPSVARAQPPAPVLVSKAAFKDLPIQSSPPPSLLSSFHWLLIFLHFVAFKPLTLFNIPKQPQGREMQEGPDAAEEGPDAADFPLVVLTFLLFFCLKMVLKKSLNFFLGSLSNPKHSS